MATVHEVVAFLTGLPKHCTQPHILHCQDQPAGQGPGRQVPCPHRREEWCLRCPFFQVPNLTTSTKGSLIYPLWPLFPDTVQLEGLEKKTCCSWALGRGFSVREAMTVPAKCLPCRGIVSTSNLHDRHFDGDKQGHVPETNLHFPL